MGGLCDTTGIAMLKNLKHLVWRVDLHSFDARNLEFVVVVFSDDKFALVVQQIEELATIDFEETGSEIRFFFSVFTLTQTKEVVDGETLNTFHGIGLARASLPVSKTRDDALIEEVLQNRVDHRLVERFCGFHIPIDIVKLEVSGVDILRDSIYFDLGFMNSDGRVAR